MARLALLLLSASSCVCWEREKDRETERGEEKWREGESERWIQRETEREQEKSSSVITTYLFANTTSYIVQSS